MNLISQLNSFWEKNEVEANLKPTSILVYLALLQINNRTGWKIMFRVSYGQVLSMTGISNVKTYYSALKELVDTGYIQYQKGPNQYQSASFSINVLYQNLEEHGKSNGKAIAIAPEKHLEEHGKSNGNIPKQLNSKTINNKTLPAESANSALFSSLVDYWLKTLHPNWSFDAVSGKSLKGLITKIRSHLISDHKDSTDQHIKSAFIHTCENLPEWFKDKDLPIINSKFNEIIAQIKTASSDKTTVLPPSRKPINHQNYE